MSSNEHPDMSGSGCDDIYCPECELKDQEIATLNADIEILMEALDTLAYTTTVGPAIMDNLGEAARNEICLRAEIADKARQRTVTWKRVDADPSLLCPPEYGTATGHWEGCGVPDHCAGCGGTKAEHGRSSAQETE